MPGASMPRGLPCLLLAALPCLPACAGTLAPERQQELQDLLHEDCGACHGMRLTGGLGPALTPRALAGKPRALLVDTIRDGRPGTPMPPWKNLLGEQDIAWLVDYLMQVRQ
jgi:cytochrome c55X